MLSSSFYNKSILFTKKVETFTLFSFLPLRTRMPSCFIASPCGSSCRRLAKNSHTPFINMMPPAESSLDSTRRSLLPEKVCVSSTEKTKKLLSGSLIRCALHTNVNSLFMFFVFSALATLKPQAGLVTPQAVPASQPSAAVS